jgi:hypothetical protein
MEIKRIEKKKKFIPKFNGNRDLPEEAQVVVNIKKYPALQDLGKIKAHKFDADGNVMINYQDGYLLKNFIGSISNLDKDEKLPEGEDLVTNGSSLAKSTATFLEGLVSEIREHLLETAEVLDEKES